MRIFIAFLDFDFSIRYMLYKYGFEIITDIFHDI